LVDYNDSDDLAEIYMYDLHKTDQCFDGFLFSEIHVVHAFELLTKPEEFEIIWVRIVNTDMAVPAGYRSIGFEGSYFDGDHFSPSCDCMMIPRWHGTDKEGVLFKAYFEKLNEYGMFTTVDAVKEFLEYYESFDWTEVGPYEIVEVFVRG
jgi:hypothetical protein